MGSGLFLENMALHGVPRRPAELLGPVGRQPALIVQDGVPALVVVLGQLLPTAHLLGEFLGQFLGEELTHLLTEGAFFVCIAQVHVGPL